jgi:diguanylate cyclase
MTPVEIARQALHRLAELGLPPTPENYEVQYRSIAGLPPQKAPGAAETLEMVRALLQLVSNANDGLNADLAQFNQESTSLLAEVERSNDPAALGELFKAMTASSSWLLGQVDTTRRELTSTREQLNKVHAELEQQQALAVTDMLTSMPNRRGIGVALSRELSRSRRNKSALCVAMLDIDHFKRINDRFGHATGDRALIHFATLIRPSIRETDMAGRYGGEEFLLVLPDTALAGAEFVLNRLISKLEHAPLAVDGEQLHLRFSAGLAQWCEGESAEQLVGRSDAALYLAKKAGRGRVEVAPGPENAPTTASAQAASAS